MSLEILRHLERSCFHDRRKKEVDGLIRDHFPAKNRVSLPWSQL
ncbi:MAG: hypothetical protein ACR2PU_01940 [Gammaproteobacteria bacterium]